MRHGIDCSFVDTEPLAQSTFGDFVDAEWRFVREHREPIDTEIARRWEPKVWSDGDFIRAGARDDTATAYKHRLRENPPAGSKDRALLGLYIGRAPRPSGRFTSREPKGWGVRDLGLLAEMFYEFPEWFEVAGYWPSDLVYVSGGSGRTGGWTLPNGKEQRRPQPQVTMGTEPEDTYDTYGNKLANQARRFTHSQWGVYELAVGYLRAQPQIALALGRSEDAVKQSFRTARGRVARWQREQPRGKSIPSRRTRSRKQPVAVR